MESISDIPKYIEIREKIKTEIQDGTLSPGQRLPSNDELARSFSVSRMTVRKALLDLATMGLIHKQQGVGTFISQVNVTADYTKLTSFSEDAINQGKTPSAKLIGIKRITVEGEIARDLLLKNDDNVIVVERLRFIDNYPVAIQVSYLSEKLFPELINEDEKALQSMNVYIAQRGHKSIRAIETISAKIATDKQAEDLDINKGEALIYIERITFAQNGTPIEFIKTYNRPDRYNCTILLEK
jgi:GntR family transcriptional regulator